MWIIISKLQIPDCNIWLGVMMQHYSYSVYWMKKKIHFNVLNLSSLVKLLWLKIIYVSEVELLFVIILHKNSHLFTIWHEKFYKKIMILMLSYNLFSRLCLQIIAIKILFINYCGKDVNWGKYIYLNNTTYFHSK